MTIKRYDLYDDCSPYCEESSGGEYCKWSDVKPVIAERDDLKRRLAVFTEGIPSKDALEYSSRALRWHSEIRKTMGATKSAEQTLGVSEWLKLIATAEVPK